MRSFLQFLRVFFDVVGRFHIELDVRFWHDAFPVKFVEKVVILRDFRSAGLVIDRLAHRHPLGDPPVVFLEHLSRALFEEPPEDPRKETPDRRESEKEFAGGTGFSSRFLDRAVQVMDRPRFNVQIDVAVAVFRRVLLPEHDVSVEERQGIERARLVEEDMALFIFEKQAELPVALSVKVGEVGPVERAVQENIVRRLEIEHAPGQ